MAVTGAPGRALALSGPRDAVHAAMNGTGVRYAPDPDFSGRDVLAADLFVGGEGPVDSANVTLAVLAVNDPPRVEFERGVLYALENQVWPRACASRCAIDAAWPPQSGVKSCHTPPNLGRVCVCVCVCVCVWSARPGLFH